MMTTAVWASIFVVVVSVVSDITTRRMPNTVTFGGILVAMAIHGPIRVRMRRGRFFHAQREPSDSAAIRLLAPAYAALRREREGGR